MKKIWINDYNITKTPGSFKDYHTQIYGAGYCPVDRFDLLKHIDPQPAELQFKNIVPEPIYNLNNLTTDWRDRFFSIADQVGDKIYEKAKDRAIVLMWSGGFDSTVALVSLMRSRYYSEFLQNGKFKIGMSSSSISEYPEMFYNKILNKIPFVMADHNALMSDPDVLMVTGDGGDYLIGNTDTPIFEYQNTTNNLMADKTELWSYLDRAESTGKFSYFLKELCKYAPFDIVSLNQAYWWLGQCFTHQGEMCLAYAWSQVDDLSEIGTFNKVYRFFLDDLWNTFCFEYMSTNPEYTNFDSVRNFHKEYIINYTGDQNYNKKRKLYSQRYLLRMYYKSIIYEDYTWASSSRSIIS
jgi:hypothetical protein